MLDRVNGELIGNECTPKNVCRRNYCLIPATRKFLVPVLAWPCLRTYCLLFLTLSVWGAGVNKKLVVKPDTPEGNFLELISLETDFDKRLTAELVLGIVVVLEEVRRAAIDAGAIAFTYDSPLP